ncbi:fumarylacetoacetate hydrolase family protein [Bacillus sp. EB106-08-02-XG196]|jgi:2-keto-4-pentenoate hydratase/2-oxohepta-3-ene-1,7-dioic acid hydratase in catechol pathway|uniref:fumarylacetoacetate hydrolase family protein n=1 Tax=Bacillus sp. EB106-08-02-XG196 TaxID=2737049 RepID=UPI0015C48339|nr:fumarylacetoacetate hydrolase family protein [Bacillus sp. EB106-08-02-XG196]NWQ42247.1 fumarylacetoacetate hydrolase family protein [Bacillus sp. EB106-08-02-XG196]
MKLVTIKKEGKYVLGVKTEKGLIDLEEALKKNPTNQVHTNIMEVIAGGKEALTAIKDYIANLPIDSKPKYIKDEKEVEWGPCVTQPNKIICIGLNYRKHADETKSPYPEVPILFSKFNNALTGHECEIAVPKVTQRLDYEVELGVVIGEEAKYVSKENALDYVFGYCTANDLSARDLQKKTHQWLLGKTCDDFSPIGPYLVTADEITDPNNLQLKTYVNGEKRQDSNTSDMIFYVDEIVSYISQHMTLTPGDVILTGTPEGVIIGYPREKRVYLKPGDVVTVEVEKLGTLTNKLIEE